MTLRSIDLCTNLMHADSATEVKQILTQAGYWGDESAWRPFSDTENNFGSIGNQQSDPVAALVEKLINSIDARLMGLAAERNITPDSPECPKDMREAIAAFVEGKAAPYGDAAGNIFYWTDADIRRESKNISIFATGKKTPNYPCLTISDRGEGQTPDFIPVTLMASGRSNKIRIPYVQGKFNMGGTGVFQFCSDEEKHQIQLVISRRNPKLVSENAPNRDKEWGFTILRRVSRPGMKSSIYEYLAPLANKSILSFSADYYPIFPSDDKGRPVAYKKTSDYGTLIKLFEYNYKVKSNIIFKGSRGDSLKVQIEEMLPEAALPIQIVECREYGGNDRRSFEDEILGAVTQLDNMDQEAKADRLETANPITGRVTLHGTGLPIRIYVFKYDPNKTRYNPAGVFFTVNGQTHAHEPSRFFNKANLSYIKDSLLVVVDCSNMSNLDRENVFMNSRDRMRVGQDSQELKDALEKFLRDEPLLKELNRKRQQEKIKHSLEDQKPLEETLKRLVKENPQLANLLPFGLKIPTIMSGSGSVGTNAIDFHGKQTPSFFRFKGNKSELHRELPINQNSRIQFETDVQDDYFSRKSLPGDLQIAVKDQNDNDIRVNYRIGNLHNGLLTVVLDFDRKNHEVGDSLKFSFSIGDERLLVPFKNTLFLILKGPAESNHSGTNGSDSVANKGKGDSGGTKSAGLPNIIPISRDEWEVEEFTEESAIKVRSNPDGGYDFYYNKDNKHLKHAQSSTSNDPNVLDHQYKIGLMLFSLAIIEATKQPLEEDEPRILIEGEMERAVLEITKAVSPYWLSILQALQGLKFDQTMSLD